MIKERLERHEGYRQYHLAVPSDHSSQMTAERTARSLFDSSAAPARVLDLGCGDGSSIDLFKQLETPVEWFGVDVDSSPEGRRRKRTDGCFAIYDGRNLPYGDGVFDGVYTKHVLHHVRCPDTVLGEAFRVLKPGGVLLGSLSYLEPYQSLSLFNYTPFGAICLLRDAGFHGIELRPGIDCVSLIAYHALHEPDWFGRFFHKRSMGNLAVDLMRLLFRLEHKHANFLKIQFAGHLCFVGRKPT